MTAGPREEVARLRGTARRLLWAAMVCVVVPAVSWLGVALFEGLAPGSGGQAPGFLSALLVLYLAPVGVVLLVLGLVARAWAWWLDRGLDRSGAAPGNEAS